MDMEDDDDFYGPEDLENTTDPLGAAAAPTTASKPPPRDDLEEGEEEDEGGAMDEDESQDVEATGKDGPKAILPHHPQAKYSEIRNIPSRTAASESITNVPPIKGEERQEPQAQSGPSIDINPNPVYKSVGKPIMSVSIDEDLAAKDKPWRKPGTDLSDYFNYGFDEFSWSLYADKQNKIRSEYGSEAVEQRTKKMMEEMMGMMMMPGMSGSMAAGGMPSGMEGMTPEMMQAMMQQMMGSGMDPSQMDPSAMAAMFAGMQNHAAGGGSGTGGQQGGQGQNFGGQGYGGNQNQGYGGYDQSGMSQRGGFGGGRGNRGGRRNW